MVNGVLVERTVKDVLPTLKTNSDGLKQVLEGMLKQYKLKQTELDTWKVRASLIRGPCSAERCIGPKGRGKQANNSVPTL